MSNRNAFLSFRNLYKTFNMGTISQTTVFSDFNLEIQKGEFVSIVGSNGSGKTTLLNLACGSLTVDDGSIILEGRDLAKLPEYRRATTIGRVFQDPSKGTCPNLTIMENMALAELKNKRFGLGFGVNRRRADYYRSELERLHMGLEDKLDVLVGSLSGGQRQALALLIATMTPIHLLVLDEHTAALDPKSSETVMEITDQVIKEKDLTAVMVTHNLRFAVDYGTRLLMMDKGHCVIDSGADGKDQYHIEDLLKTFNAISIECGN